MPPFVDITGMRFGKLLIVKACGKNKQGGYMWECLCDCGVTITASGSSIRYGNTRSCGCTHRGLIGKLMQTHGMSSTRLYKVFHAMHARCSNPKNKVYHFYGARGIRVCERWRKPEGFADFVADMGIPEDGMTIDRINNDGNYEPSNCKWASRGEQSNNRRSTHLVTWRNQTRNLTQWSSLLGKRSSWLSKRLKRLPLDEAMEPLTKALLDLTQAELERTADHTTKGCLEARIEKLQMLAAREGAVTIE